MKRYIISIIIGFILIACGAGIFVVEIMNYNYVDKLPKSEIANVDTFNYNLNEKSIYINDYNADVEYIIDENIDSNKIKIEVSYYNIVNTINASDKLINGNRVITFNKNAKANNFKYFYDLLIDNLKDKKVYNYTLFNDINIKVYVNEDDLKYVKSYKEINENRFYIKDETVFCAAMLEEIARDNEYIYYLKCLKSNTIYLVFNDNTKISIRNALKTNVVTIYELIDAGLEVYKETINI